MALVQFSQKSKTSLYAIDQKFGEELAGHNDKLAFKVAHQFLACGEALADIPSLTRALTNLNASTKAKTTLVTSLTKAIKAEKIVESVLVEMTKVRWSKPADVFWACCELGFNTLMISLSKRKGGKEELERIEAELFHMIRAIKDSSQSNPQVAQLNDYLSSQVQPLGARFSTIETLFASQVDSATLLLAKSATMAVRNGQRFVNVLQTISDEIAQVRGLKSVHVCAAVPLSSTQQERLKTMLQQRVNTDIQLNIVVDSSILGGIKIQFDGTVFDATLATQLKDFEKSIISKV